MITVEYLITGRYGELQRVSGDGRVVRFKLGEGVSGTLTLGGKSTEVKGGDGRITTVGLVHGQYIPVLVTSKETVELEPVLISGERVTPAPTSEAIHRYALERLFKLESKIKNLEERINELESSIKGTALFG